MCRRGCALFAVVAIGLAAAGCTTDGRPVASLATPRGASVAFESIDGPPVGIFHKLVQSLNEEAQARQIAVISREQPSAYRVRGYLAAHVASGRTSIAWVWDVYDAEQRRALRIAGEEAVAGKHRDAWAAADGEVLRRIARSGMEGLATFLASPETAPGPAMPAPPAGGGVAVARAGDSSPEAAGIFRIFQGRSEPGSEPAAVAESDPPGSADVPLPRRRPPVAAGLVAAETLVFAASGR